MARKFEESCWFFELESVSDMPRRGEAMVKSHCEVGCWSKKVRLGSAVVHTLGEGDNHKN